jgi:hypothetical protein
MSQDANTEKTVGQRDINAELAQGREEIVAVETTADKVAFGILALMVWVFMATVRGERWVHGLGVTLVCSLVGHYGYSVFLLKRRALWDRAVRETRRMGYPNEATGWESFKESYTREHSLEVGAWQILRFTTVAYILIYQLIALSS